MIELHRDAVEFLRDYGATDISVDQNGGKHPRLVFEFHGKRVSHPVSSSPSDMNAARVLIRSLKRRLGDPDASVESKTKKALNDMTPSVPTPPVPPAVNSPAAGMRINTDGIYPAKRSVGRVAKYSRRLRFIVPYDICGMFVHMGGCSLLTGSSAWTICPNDARSTPALRTDKSTKIGKIIDFKVKDKETKFGATRAEFWVAQGVIHVECVEPLKQIDEAGRKGLGISRKHPSIVSAAITPPAPEPIAARPLTVPAERMRAVLAEIRKIEAETPYRLVKGKDTGTWAFSAPRIE